MSALLKPSYRTLLFVPLFVVGCSMGSGAVLQTGERVYVLGRHTFTAPTQSVVSYGADRTWFFLRYRLNDEVDIVFDSAFSSIKDPDFLSVTPTQFGLGRVKVLGSKRVICSRMAHYGCGAKIRYRDIDVVFVFSSAPTSELEIALAEKSVLSALKKRLK